MATRKMRTTKKTKSHSKKRYHKKKVTSKKHKGGNLATVGEPFQGGDVKSWPGVSSPHSGNHYPLNNSIQRLPINTQGGASKKRKYKKLRKGSKSKKLRKGSKSKKLRKQKGGNIFTTFFPEATLATRGVAYNLGSAYNTFKGYPAPVNPRPWVQPQLLKSQRLMI